MDLLLGVVNHISIPITYFLLDIGGRGPSHTWEEYESNKKNNDWQRIEVGLVQSTKKVNSIVEPNLFHHLCHMNVVSFIKTFTHNKSFPWKNTFLVKTCILMICKVPVETFGTYFAGKEEEYVSLHNDVGSAYIKFFSELNCHHKKV